MALKLTLQCGLLWCGVIIRELAGSDRKEDALWRVIFVQIQTAKKKKEKTTITFPLRGILVTCRETGSLHEQVKQKANF